MKKRITGIFLAVLTIAMAVDVPTSHAQEQAAESITLSPVSSRFAVDAGVQRTGELTIVNDGKVGYDFIVYSRPYSVANESYSPDFTKAKSNADAYKWVRLPQAKFHADAGATVKVPYSIDVPAAAAPGGHYGVIFAETQPAAQSSNGNAVVRKKRVGMILYASVNGNTIKKGEVAGVTMPFWQVEPPLGGTVAAKNDGNVDFIDTVSFTVKDLFGNIKYSATKEYAVLPQTTRKIPVEWEKSPPFGLFKVETHQKFLDKQQSTSGYVLMMPRFLPVMLLVILLIGGGYALYRHKKK